MTAVRSCQISCRFNITGPHKPAKRETPPYRLDLLHVSELPMCTRWHAERFPPNRPSSTAVKRFPVLGWKPCATGKEFSSLWAHVQARSTVGYSRRFLLLVGGSPLASWSCPSGCADRVRPLATRKRIPRLYLYIMLLIAHVSAGRGRWRTENPFTLETVDNS